ncbi:stage IV sporulation protein FB [Brevibacillus fluminis]|uniref:Stage IV sporulation protein FB n=1 Tax=Brevibacillus fluminis TaxID=511487 RepID=A0A3M8DR27_9BACL|nr:M50 family metallopeptidase [Brevibacillus fluminis]RNB90580.1 stage IV sporulation protein FB [Brevibacillus fluminis]
MSNLQFRGIKFRIHLLFWGVIALSLAAGYFIETITLFVIIFIHELGHIAVARELGWTVKEVQFLPFGGVAIMEDEAASAPLDEIVIALAGPFMNIVMIFFSLLFWRFGWWTEEWTQFFMVSNWLIAGFNLLPIWPLDGGRIVQAILCFWLPFRMAALGTLGMSVLLAGILLGSGLFFHHINSVVVALYLLFVNIEAFLRFPYHFIRFLMDKYARLEEEERMHPVAVHGATSVAGACQELRRGYQHMFIVKGKSGGILTEERLLYALLVERRHQHPISSLLT